MVRENSDVKAKAQRKFGFLSCFFFLSFLLILASPVASANNLRITNVRLINQDQAEDTVVVEFDISWDNSWKDSVNNDAAWVFIVPRDYDEDGEVNGIYRGLLTESGTNPSSFSTGSGTAIDIIVPDDKVGCFIQRRHMGTGTLTTTDVQIVWDYGSSGVTDSRISDYICASATSAGCIRFKLIGIEMVYVPEGGFHVGDGGDGTEAEFEYGSSSSLPCPINSEAGISFSNVTGGGWYYNSAGATGEYSSGATFNVPSSFPKGYQAFYMMKYEITQGQYVGFLNTLPATGQIYRTAISVGTGSFTRKYSMTNTSTIQYRSIITNTTGVVLPGSQIFSASSSAGRNNRSVNYLTWMDLAAYADWAGLRPMTEFEYEKAARGPLYPVANEYAWGSTSITQAVRISGTEGGTETIVTTSANAAYNRSADYSGGDAGQGPLRAGIFSTSTSTTRQSAGGNYYGAMELSGNIQEFVVTVGNATGVGFAGTHGDGYLSTQSLGWSFADVADWPGFSPSQNKVVGATGSGFRGGAFNSGATYLEISNRGKAAYEDATRQKEYGGRLVRTAP